MKDYVSTPCKLCFLSFVFFLTIGVSLAAAARYPQEEAKLTGEAKMMMSLLDLNNNGQLEEDEL